MCECVCAELEAELRRQQQRQAVARPASVRLPTTAAMGISAYTWPMCKSVLAQQRDRSNAGRQARRGQMEESQASEPTAEPTTTNTQRELASELRSPSEQGACRGARRAPSPRPADEELKSLTQAVHCYVIKAIVVVAAAVVRRGTQRSPLRKPYLHHQQQPEATLILCVQPLACHSSGPESSCLFSIVTCFCNC